VTSKRLYLVLLSVIGLLVITLIAGAYNINKLLGSQATKLTAAKATSLALQEEQESLVKAKQEIKSYTNLQQITEAVVPEDKNTAEAVLEIVNIATANGISLASITLPTSTLGGTTATAAASSSASNALSQLTPVADIPGVYELSITVTNDPTKPVQYNQFIAFLSSLEYNRRTAQVGTISLTPDTKNGSLLDFSLGINEYIKP
jgi:hypothetical protein